MGGCMYGCMHEYAWMRGCMHVCMWAHRKSSRHKPYIAGYKRYGLFEDIPENTLVYSNWFPSNDGL